MLDPEVEARPWDEQVALDDIAYRAQLEYLLGRSPFYRRKLGAAGLDAAKDAGGLDEVGQLPLTEKYELRETVAPDDPIGAHLCATREEIVRIYSTSGTTGMPSYVPLTSGDLENWVAGSARSYAASGVTAGERIVSTYNAGPFVAGAALASFDRIGLCHVPVGTGNTERLIRAIELLRPEAAVLTPSYAAYLVEWAAERGISLAGSSVTRVLVAGEPGGGELAFRAMLEEGSSASARRRTACTSARVTSSTRSWSTPRREPRARSATAAPASWSSRICGTARRRCFASGRVTMSRCGPACAGAGGPARASGASGGRTTC
jgi:phenylacetate-CoA ligase